MGVQYDQAHRKAHSQPLVLRPEEILRSARWPCRRWGVDNFQRPSSPPVRLLELYTECKRSHDSARGQTRVLVDLRKPVQDFRSSSSGSSACSGPLKQRSHCHKKSLRQIFLAARQIFSNKLGLVDSFSSTMNSGTLRANPKCNKTVTWHGYIVVNPTHSHQVVNSP